MRNNNGQVSIEFMALVVISLAVFAGIAMYGYTGTQTQRRGLFLSYLQSNLDKIEATIEAIASAGLGSSNTITLYYPEDPYGEDTKLAMPPGVTATKKIGYLFGTKTDFEIYRDNLPIPVRITPGPIPVKVGYTTLRITKPLDYKGYLIIEEVRP